jgi:hypothetical protein
MPMRKSRFPESRPPHALGQTNVCRAMGVTVQTYYRWNKQYGGLAV